MNYGYNFYFADGSDLLTFPITPSELTIKVGSNNKVVTLINEGDINILKSPSLTEVEFEARFPMRQYPYARQFSNFENYWNKFKELKEKKKSFRFIVARSTPKGSRTWDTNLLVALEDISFKESADEGDDVLVSFTLKQYKDYGVKKLPDSYLQNIHNKQNQTNNTSTATTTSTSNKPRSEDTKPRLPAEHKVQSGDTLWAIAKKYYGNGSKYTVIYNTNKNIIEKTARSYGRQSSSKGHWIYPGTKLTIPEITTTKQ